MNKFLLPAVLIVPQLAAQGVYFPDPLRNVADGYAEAIRLKMQIETQRRQAEVHKAQADLLRAQTDRLQTEERTAQPETTQNQSGQGEPSEADAARFNDVWKRVEEQFPDLPKFRPEMVRILALIRTNDFSTSQHLELLYILAKYASFSRSPFAAALPPSESPKVDVRKIELPATFKGTNQ